MANIELMPKLGMTMTHGIITKWLKKQGEKIEQGEPLLEIETDKVTMEEESSFSGIILKILAEEGETIPVNQPIAIIGEQNEDISEILKKTNSNIDKNNSKDSEKTEQPMQQPVNKPRATPAARKIAFENKIDLNQITGSGPDNRIQRKDVEEYIENLKNRKYNIIEEPKKLKERSNLKTIPLTGMRNIIANKMQQSMNIAPHFYITMDIDMSEILRLKDILNDKAQDIKITINTILIKASSKAIKQYPIINSFINNGEIILKEQINIGLAVAIEDGLIVPVIKEADKKGLSEIATDEKELIDKAREGKLLPDEYNGGSFTISNLGMFDVTNFTAIINQPEVAILAVGKIIESPIVINSEIKIKPIMKITLSSDHRVIDGAVAAKFLKRIKELLEDPIQLML